MSITIHNDDCLTAMRRMDAGSVHCCVTSPPYWGLRDYGTGEWIGGDEDCEHVQPASDRNDNREKVPYKDVCGLCGAKMEDRQLGLESTPDEFVAKMVEVFREVWRVLRDDGTLFLNLGDSYNGVGGPGKQDGGRIGPTAAKAIEGTSGTHVLGLKPKDLIGIPWRVAFALQADGWTLRSDIIWHKPNTMPESCTDRPTKSHEYVFLMTKRARYYYDADAVRETSVPSGWDKQRATGVDTWKYGRAAGGCGIDNHNGIGGTLLHGSGRNRRTVWTISTEPFRAAHFATFPRALVVPCLKAGTSERGCCRECGAPWRRVVEKTTVTRERPNEYVKRTGAPGTGNCINQTVSGVSVHTTGWTPGCKCERQWDAGIEKWVNGPRHTVPCIAFDPFCGSGTVGVVAKQLGLDFVGIELNAEYADMARRRIANPEPEPVVAEVPGQMELYE